MMAEDYEADFDCPPLDDGVDLAPGYRIIEHLHQSNNFDVYDVWSEERACRCIAKTPRQDLADDAKVERGLLREGRLLKKLAHPHIARIYETLKEPYPALILETLTGDTLSYIIDTGSRRMSIPDIVHLGLHLCSAVHYLHGHGILHLDLKPSNIVSERQMAKILDLSIARPPGRSKKGAGTPHYMAPEQVRGELVSSKTDIWGIGATLYEASTAEKPFNATEEETGPEEHTDQEGSSHYDTGTDLDSYEQVLRRAEPIRAYRRVPRSFAEAVDSCLEPMPEKRPSVSGLNGLLNEVLHSL